MENNEQEIFDQLMRIIEEKKIRRTKTVGKPSNSGRSTRVHDSLGEGESRRQRD
jgi:hypothetical protein